MMADGGQETQDSFIPNDAHQKRFRAALGQFTTGVTLVTTTSSKGPVGFIANSFSSVSIEPPLVLWSLAKSARRYDDFVTAPHFAIHILGANDNYLFERFQYNGYNFSALDYSVNAQEVPLMQGCLARFECDLYASYTGGDHSIILGQVARVTAQSAAPMVFHAGKLVEVTDQPFVKRLLA
jgi:flavin reductase (DIM6/NTAB) family NADH-FMN oxidoreductase RutF